MEKGNSCTAKVETLISIRRAFSGSAAVEHPNTESLSYVCQRHILMPKPRRKLPHETRTSCRAKGLLKKLMHCTPPDAPSAQVPLQSDLDSSANADPLPPSPSPPKAAAANQKHRTAHLPHVTARYPFKDGRSTMQQVLFQDALDNAAAGERLSTAAAAHRDMQNALQAMTRAQQQPVKHSDDALVQHREAAGAGPASRAAARDSEAVPSARKRGAEGVTSRFKGAKLPKPTKLCYGGERRRTAPRPKAAVKGHQGGSPSRLPVRRAA